MEWGRPVTEVIGDRLWLTVVVSISAILLTWAIALPIGIYSAVRQYSVADYAFTLWLGAGEKQISARLLTASEHTTRSAALGAWLLVLRGGTPLSLAGLGRRKDATARACAALPRDDERQRQRRHREHQLSSAGCRHDREHVARAR